MALQLPPVLRVRLPGALPRAPVCADAAAGGAAEGGHVVVVVRGAADDGPVGAAEEGRRVQRRRAGRVRPLRGGRRERCCTTVCQKSIAT